jgi:hypothetical protein
LLSFLLLLLSFSLQRNLCKSIYLELQSQLLPPFALVSSPPRLASALALPPRLHLVSLRLVSASKRLGPPCRRYKILRILDGDNEAVNEDDLSRDDTTESPSRQHADTTDEQAAVAAILYIARKIVAKVRKSTHLWEVLERFQLVQEMKPAKKLILDVCTRWNSTHHMVRRLIQLRSAVDPLCTSQPKLKKLNPVLDDFDWEWLGKPDSILSIFSKPTEVISGESYPTLSQHLPQYWKLAAQLRNIQNTFRPGATDHNDTAYEACEAAWTKLNKYHIKTDSFTAPCIATILDPRLKLETLEPGLEA